jgi:hypothetical protein
MNVDARDRAVPSVFLHPLRQVLVSVLVLLLLLLWLFVRELFRFENTVYSFGFLELLHQINSKVQNKERLAQFCDNYSTAAPHSLVQYSTVLYCTAQVLQRTEQCTVQQRTAM